MWKTTTDKVIFTMACIGLALMIGQKIEEVKHPSYNYSCKKGHLELLLKNQDGSKTWYPTTYKCKKGTYEK